MMEDAGVLDEEDDDPEKRQPESVTVGDGEDYEGYLFKSASGGNL